MTSAARINANRRNALKSTGPKTPAGKRRVRLNALWHGAFASDPVLPQEDSTAFLRLRDGFHQAYQPASPVENELVDRIVRASWSLKRLAAMEPRILRAHIALLSSGLGDEVSFRSLVLGSCAEPQPAAQVPGNADPFAAAWLADAEGPNHLSKLYRYQTTLERSYYRAVEDLRRLRAARTPPKEA